jgi:hypothetical protein
MIDKSESDHALEHEPLPRLDAETVQRLIEKWREVARVKRSLVPDAPNIHFLEYCADDLAALLGGATRPEPERKIEHVCGLQGYCPGYPHYDPPCPACVEMRKRLARERAD